MPGFLTMQQDVAIDGAPLLAIRSLLDRMQYADPRGEAAALGISQASWSMFGVLWPSGLRLAAHTAANWPAPEARVLEIGCGLALASLVCHRAGIDITASDRHPLTAEFLRANEALNGLAPMKYRHGDWSRAAVDRPATERCRVSGTFDLILGSDLLYERDANAELAGFIGLQSQADGEVRIVDPDRGNRPAFNRQMADHGFGMTEERLDRVASSGVASYKGRLLTYRRGAQRRPA
ncbi:MAG: class I SAM-dependent methyltransferase [Burkholderiales bacterium]